jgi:gluconolactonase
MTKHIHRRDFIRWLGIGTAVLLSLTLIAVAGEPAKVPGTLVAPGAELVELAHSFQFTEGPAADAEGNVFFSDVAASRTYKWSVDGQISTVRENTGHANGLAFDQHGNLLACEGENGRLVCVGPGGSMAVLADQYNGKRFNQPNDLWIDPKGGVYFSDPIYGRARKVQDGECVYYLSPDHKKVIRVIADMVRPNGLVGTPDGKVLYATDWGDRKTYKYDIAGDGTLSNKRPFAPVGADGMKIDSEGNVYMAERGILIYDSAGSRLGEIDVPNQPTNLCFAGKDGQTLFITARTSIYSIRMSVKGPSRLAPPRE